LKFNEIAGKIIFWGLFAVIMAAISGVLYKLIVFFFGGVK